MKHKSGKKAQGLETDAKPGDRQVAAAASDIHRIALISHHYKKVDSNGRRDYSEHFQAINKLCNEHQCDTIVYSLWTWDTCANSGQELPTNIFSDFEYVNRVLFEAANISIASDSNDPIIHVWEKGALGSRQYEQRFATSSEAKSKKRAEGLLKEFSNRRIGKALLLICGESNLVYYNNKHGVMTDPLKVMARLDRSKTKIVLNPCHDYMSYRMWRKRKHLSQGRCFVSVWNQGKGRDSPDGPWMVCENGEISKNRVKELPTPFPDRPDIRIGILSVKV